MRFAIFVRGGPCETTSADLCRGCANADARDHGGVLGGCTNVASATPHFGNTFGPRFDRPLPPSAPQGGWFDYVYNCRGGDIPPGTYSWMVITGQCYMPVGTVTIRDDLTVAPGALLDAVTPGDPVAGPVVPATVFIGGNVWVGAGAVLLLGCSPNISCSNPPGITNDRIGGSLTGWGALGVVVHSASVGGSVALLGGGGGANCNTTPPTPPSTATAPAPWSDDASLANTPVYSDFEDTTWAGISPSAGCSRAGSAPERPGRWQHHHRQQHHGRPRRHGGRQQPHQWEHGLLRQLRRWCGHGAVRRRRCSPQLGGRLGERPMRLQRPGAQPSTRSLGPTIPSTDLHLDNVYPRAHRGDTHTLGTYYGTHTQVGPSLDTLSLGVTASGNTLGAQLNNVVFAGTGLTGAVTAVYPPTTADPLGSTGETVITTDSSRWFRVVPGR